MLKRNFRNLIFCAILLLWNIKIDIWDNKIYDNQYVKIGFENWLV
jgi:hypothetical protein